MTAQKPLPERMRPDDPDLFLGQSHLASRLKSLMAAERLPSLLLFGPPGCGWDSEPSLPPSLLHLSSCAPAILHLCWLCTAPPGLLAQGLFAERGDIFRGGIKNPRMFPCREKVIEAAPRAQSRNPSRQVHKVDDAGEEENVLGAALHRLAFSALPMVSVYRIKQ